MLCTSHKSCIAGITARRFSGCLFLRRLHWLAFGLPWVILVDILTVKEYNYIHYSFFVYCTVVVPYRYWLNHSSPVAYRCVNPDDPL